MITGNVVPDHATIARFVVRHEAALADLFGEVLRLCDEAGLVKPGVGRDRRHTDGGVTRARGANREFEQIAREILPSTRRPTRPRIEQFGDARGDELPEQLRTAEGRREFFRRAKQERRDPGSDRPGRPCRSRRRRSGSSSLRRSGSSRASRVGRAGCATLSASSSSTAGRSLTRSLAHAPERLLLAAERLEGELDAERRGNEAYEQFGRDGRMKAVAGSAARRSPTATGGPGREGEPDRPRQQADEGQRGVRAGL